MTVTDQGGETKSTKIKIEPEAALSRSYCIGSRDVYAYKSRLMPRARTHSDKHSLFIKSYPFTTVALDVALTILNLVIRTLNTGHLHWTCTLDTSPLKTRLQKPNLRLQTLLSRPQTQSSQRPNDATKDDERKMYMHMHMYKQADHLRPTHVVVGRTSDQSNRVPSGHRPSGKY